MGKEKQNDVAPCVVVDGWFFLGAAGIGILKNALHNTLCNLKAIVHYIIVLKNAMFRNSSYLARNVRYVVNVKQHSVTYITMQAEFL